MDDVVSRAALTRLSARLSFNDFPDFLLIACRGDLSDIIGPFIVGAWSVPIGRSYLRGAPAGLEKRGCCVAAGALRRRHELTLRVSSKDLENPARPG